MPEIHTYQRKTFDVQAVQVTIENMEEVADWCKGTIESVSRTRQGNPYIKVPVRNSQNTDLAFVHDWVVMNPAGNFQVYKKRSFLGVFEKKTAEG